MQRVLDLNNYASLNCIECFFNITCIRLIDMKQCITPCCICICTQFRHHTLREPIKHFTNASTHSKRQFLFVSTNEKFNNSPLTYRTAADNTRSKRFQSTNEQKLLLVHQSFNKK